MCRNGAGHTAYVVAKDKNVRDAFRRFMAQHPTSYDYTAAKVPSPLTEEMERERKEKMAEKKRAQKRAKKQREKVSTVTWAALKTQKILLIESTDASVVMLLHCRV